MASGRWNDMQMDCLVNIFSKLGFNDLTSSVSLVCKSWLEASLDSLCYRNLDLRFLDYNQSAISSSDVFSFSGYLKLVLSRAQGAAVDLRFPSIATVTKQDLTLASDECPMLKILSLPRLESEDEEHLLNVIAKLKQLEVLEMDSKPSDLPAMARHIGIHCEKFQGLKLRGSISKEDAAAIVGSLPNLKWLDLSSSWMGRAEVIALTEGCKNLRRLNVRDCIGFESDEEMVRMGSGIQVFELEGSIIEDKCELEVEDDQHISVDQMFMYYDDCYAMWLF